MSEKSLYQFYLGLLPNLLNELYFFIPKVHETKEIISNIKTIDDSEFYNKTFVIDYYKGPIPYNKHRSLKWMLVIESEIGKNIFDLLEKKNKVSEQEFDYVFKKYFEFVDQLWYYADWMYTNRKKFINTDERLDGILHIQNKRFEKHFTSLVEIFYKNKIPPKAKYNFQKIIDDFYPKLNFDFTEFIKPTKSASISEINKQEKGIKNDNTSKTSNVIDNEKTIKKPLITEQEAEQVLLKKYFGINLND